VPDSTGSGGANPVDPRWAPRVVSTENLVCVDRRIHPRRRALWAIGVAGAVAFLGSTGRLPVKWASRPRPSWPVDRAHKTPVGLASSWTSTRRPTSSTRCPRERFIAGAGQAGQGRTDAGRPDPQACASRPSPAWPGQPARPHTGVKRRRRAVTAPCDGPKRAGPAAQQRDGRDCATAVRRARRPWTSSSATDHERRSAELSETAAGGLARRDLAYARRVVTAPKERRLGVRLSPPIPTPKPKRAPGNVTRTPKRVRRRDEERKKPGRGSTRPRRRGR